MGIIRKKTTSLAKPAAGTSKNKLPLKNVFDDSDSSDSEKQPQQKANRHRDIIQRNMKKQTLMDMQKALEEDASVYDYDAVYDQMKEEKEKKSSTAKANKDRKSKYIENLMKASQRRERERLRVEERKIEKERSQEGGEFADKQQFVTSAYRKRLQERAEEERLEREEAEREAKYDVRKQWDLSGFYRHLLQQQTGEASSNQEEKKPAAKQSRTRKFKPPKKPKQAEKRPAKDDENTPTSSSSKFAKRNADASKLEALRKRFEARKKNRGDVTSRD